jgi:hypothetical protein
VALQPGGVPPRVPTGVHRPPAPGWAPHQFAALWCQFVDSRGAVKPDLATPFVTAADAAASTDELDAAFAFHVFTADSEIGLFHRHFDVHTP